MLQIFFSHPPNVMKVDMANKHQYSYKFVDIFKVSSILLQYRVPKVCDRSVGPYLSSSLFTDCLMAIASLLPPPQINCGM